jgi:hypothetical protein
MQAPDPYSSNLFLFIFLTAIPITPGFWFPKLNSHGRDWPGFRRKTRRRKKRKHCLYSLSTCQIHNGLKVCKYQLAASFMLEQSSPMEKKSLVEQHQLPYNKPKKQ